MTNEERKVIQSVYNDLQNYLDEPANLDVGEELVSISRRLFSLLAAPRLDQPAVLRWGELLVDEKETT